MSLDIYLEECQNIPPQNIPLRHKDYFELEAFESQHLQKGHSACPVPGEEEHSYINRDGEKLPCETP